MGHAIWAERQPALHTASWDSGRIGPMHGSGSMTWASHDRPQTFCCYAQVMASRKTFPPFIPAKEWVAPRISLSDTTGARPGMGDCQEKTMAEKRQEASRRQETSLN